MKRHGLLLLAGAVCGLIGPSALAANGYSESITKVDQGGVTWRIEVPAGSSLDFSVNVVLDPGSVEDSAAVFGVAMDAAGTIFDRVGYGTVVSTFDRHGQVTTVRFGDQKGELAHPSTGWAKVDWHQVGMGGKTALREQPWSLLVGGFANTSAEYFLTVSGSVPPNVSRLERGADAVSISSVSESEALVSSDGLGGATTSGSRWRFVSSGPAFFMGVPTYDGLKAPGYQVSLALDQGLPDQMDVRPPDGATRCTCSSEDLLRGGVFHYTARPRWGVPSPRGTEVALAAVLANGQAGEWTVDLSTSVSQNAPPYRVWFFDIGSVP